MTHMSKDHQSLAKLGWTLAAVKWRRWRRNAADDVRIMAGLWLRLWRIRLARWALFVCRTAADFSEWIMPEDLKRRL